MRSSQHEVTNMQNNRAILAAMAGFLGGLVVGSLIASRPQSPLRTYVSRRMRNGRTLLDRGLRQVEEQLHEIDAALERTLEQFRDRAQSARSRGEGAGSEPTDWSVQSGEVARELRHMPRH